MFMCLSIVYLLRCFGACVSRERNCNTLDVLIGGMSLTWRCFSTLFGIMLMALEGMKVGLGMFSLSFAIDGIYRHLLDCRSRPCWVLLYSWFICVPKPSQLFDIAKISLRFLQILFQSLQRYLPVVCIYRKDHYNKLLKTWIF